MGLIDRAMVSNRVVGRKLGWQLKKYVPDLHETRVKLIEDLSPQLVVDGGANRGQWAKEFRSFNRDIPIISIEPITENFHHLKGLGLANHQCQQVALSSSIGEVSMQVSSNIGMSSSIGRPLDHFSTLYPDISFNSIEKVKAVTLDSIDLLRNQRVYLKLDLEGHEWEALEGASRILGETKEVVAIELETSIRPSRSGERTHYELVPFLMDYGFRVHHLFTPGVTSSGEMNFIDCLLVRN